MNGARALLAGRVLSILKDGAPVGVHRVSNTPAPFERGRFPTVTIHDNVRLQHKLITEKLGIERLRFLLKKSEVALGPFH